MCKYNLSNNYFWCEGQPPLIINPSTCRMKMHTIFIYLFIYFARPALNTLDQD